MDHRYFRAGIGTVIYTSDGRLAFFKRAKVPVGIWQFQQGGIDPGERPIDALWRELHEETGLTETDVTLTAEMPGWTTYEDLQVATSPDTLRIGQAHHWYFLKLNEATEIDLAKATDAEFSDWKYVSFEEAILASSDRKQHVYETLRDFFISEKL